MLKIQIKTGESKMQDQGQEKEKQEISQIRDMASQILSMCDSLMQREQAEDEMEDGEGISSESGLQQNPQVQAADRLKIILKNKMAK